VSIEWFQASALEGWAVERSDDGVKVPTILSRGSVRNPSAVAAVKSGSYSPLR
jgi:hypothetical protein